MTVDTRGDVDPYAAVAGHLPNEVRLGGALITMVEPHRGASSTSTTGGTNTPTSTPAPPSVRGSSPDAAGSPRGPAAPALPGGFADRPAARRRLLHLDLLAARRPPRRRRALGHDRHDAAPLPTGPGLHRADTRVHGVQHLRVRRGPRPGRSHAAPSRPRPSLRRVGARSARSGTRTPCREVIPWLEQEFAPRAVAGTPMALCLGFFPDLLPPTPVPGVPIAPNEERLITLLWFLDVDPRRCWSHFLGHGRAYRRGRPGRAAAGGTLHPHHRGDRGLRRRAAMSSGIKRRRRPPPRSGPGCCPRPG